MIQGTTPVGAATEQQASAWVRSMFGRIAPRYDLLNHLLSLNIDRYWRTRTVKRIASVLRKPDALVLDLCCGTGDLMLALEAELAAFEGAETATLAPSGYAANLAVLTTLGGRDA